MLRFAGGRLLTRGSRELLTSDPWMSRVEVAMRQYV